MSSLKVVSIGQRLRRERERLNWSQERLAEMLSTTAKSINRWEHDKALPRPHFRRQLCAVFDQPAHVLFASAVSQEGGAIAECGLWNVPYRRNPLFTGRLGVFGELARVWHRGNRVDVTQAQALSGLGGIGKTQTAVEYAYRFREDYRAVLWMRADARETLLLDLLALAELLNLPEKNEHDVSRVARAVKYWLQDCAGWLLILDNLEDFSLLEEMLPTTFDGHILITTRAQATGNFVRRIDLEPMTTEESLLLLLRRSKVIDADQACAGAAEALRIPAQRIVHLVGGLPLALDQAGAYIEETGCSLDEYLAHFQYCQSALLQRRGTTDSTHPQSVLATLSVLLEQVANISPTAVKLLELCAFLHPDAIPEEMLLADAPDAQPMVTDAHQLDGAFAILRTFSLLGRRTEIKTLTMHRLVQAVIQERMDAEQQGAWAERAVRLVSYVFPDPGVMDICEGETIWVNCQRYLLQAQACMELIERWGMAFPAAIQLLMRMAAYFYQRGQYAEAELMFRKALVIREQVCGLEHADVAESLNDIAVLASQRGKYRQAEAMYERSLAIFEKTLGPEHPIVAEVLQHLATHEHYRGKYAQVGPLFQRALHILRKTLGDEHQDVGVALNDLARLYSFEGNFAEAEALFQQSLRIKKQARGPEQAALAIIHYNLAELYRLQGRYSEAEAQYQQALSLGEQWFGREHARVAHILNGLGLLDRDQGKLAQAEQCCRRALAMNEKWVGSDHPRTAHILKALASISIAKGCYAEAELLYQRVQAVLESALGPEHADAAENLYKLGQLYSMQQAYARAEVCYRQALCIWEKELEPDHPCILGCLQRYVELLRKMQRDGEAAALSLL